MNIIFDSEYVNFIKNNNVILELDTFYYPKLDKTFTAYCVIENISIENIDKIACDQELHREAINAYKNQNFKLCKDLITKLSGSFGGEVDSFYQELLDRMSSSNCKNLTGNWNPIVVKED